MDVIKEFIKPELFVLIPVLYFIGVGLKKTVLVPDKYIPLILGGLGITLAAVWMGATTPIVGTQGILAAIFMAATQGILCAGCSVYVNQIWKQAGGDK